MEKYPARGQNLFDWDVMSYKITEFASTTIANFMVGCAA